MAQIFFFPKMTRKLQKIKAGIYRQETAGSVGEKGVHCQLTAQVLCKERQLRCHEGAELRIQRGQHCWHSWNMEESEPWSPSGFSLHQTCVCRSCRLVGKPGTHNAGLLNGKEMGLVLVPRQTGAETVDVKRTGVVSQSLGSTGLG